MTTIIITGLILATWGVLAITLIGLFFKEGLKEVDPGSALAVKNIYSGETSKITAGTGIVTPGIEKPLQMVSLKDEPFDPEPVKVISADGVELTVDSVLETFQVMDPVKASVNIDYNKRTEYVGKRIKSYIETLLVGESTADIFEEIKVDGKTVSKIKKDFVQKVEKDMNTRLDREVLGDPSDPKSGWGIKVVYGVENISLPPKLAEVAEEAATAEKEGERIKAKAGKAGIPSWLVAIGDIITDLKRTPRGGKE